MIIEKTLGKLGDAAFAGRAADTLDIEWFNAHKKIDRRTTRGRKDVGIRLDGPAALRGLSQGDVVFDCGGGDGGGGGDGSNGGSGGGDADGCVGEDDIIAVNIIPCECIAVRARGTAQLVRLCYEIGNRHAPFFYGDRESAGASDYGSDSKCASERDSEGAGADGSIEFLTPLDKPIMEMLEKIGLEPRLVEARLLPEKRISSALGGGHSHSHGHTHSHEHPH
jgi:urease accessory protein